MSENARVRMVTSRANFDLSCQSVSVQKFSETSYGVLGCGKKASYVLIHCYDAYYQKACTISLDAVQEPSAPQRMTSPEPDTDATNSRPEQRPELRGPMCVPGTTRACVGPGACQGGQACQAGGANYGPCDCGTEEDAAM
jgi:hypothetical protein